jgi:cobalt/nickel transport system permease protein
MVITKPSPLMYSAVGLFCLASLLLSGVGAGSIIRKMAAPVSISLVILLVQSLSRGSTVAWHLSLAGFQVRIYREGLLAGTMVVGRVLSASLLLVFLGLSVPVQDFLSLLRKVRIPGFLILLSLMVYRFSFLLLEEVNRIRNAQQVRLGYAGFLNGIRSASLLGSSLFLRVQDRSERVYEAARTRGVGTSFAPSPSSGWSAKELKEALLYASALATFVVAGWMAHA